jgi:tRNA threonylcarbamoyladenosine biosynthesis protein TsaB
MWLAIDTATDRASVALGTGESDVVETSVAGARRHAAALLPAIQDLLRAREVGLDDVTGVALADGPGSFTGLRVGASVGKALVYTRGVELRIAPSLMVRAAGVADGEGTVLAVADALRGDVYAAAYRFTPARVETVLAPTVRRPEVLAVEAPRPDLLVGDVPPAIVEALEQWSGCRMIRPPEGAPHARWLIALTARAGGAVRVESASSWEPVYGRPAEAQVRWEMTHGRPLPDSVGHAR